MVPSSAPDGFSTPADCAACRAAIRQGSQSFYLASMLLPESIRQSAYAIYAFCRMADDLIDRDHGGTEAVGDLLLLLDRVYAGRPGAHFVERGFADVVARYAIPREVPEALVEGLAWDAEGRRFATLAELEAYAVRVAGTVGIMMTLVMRRRDAGVLARACDLGVAMQFTNIARDIGEDAAAGRIYLPLEWLEDEGIDAQEFLATPASSPGLRAIVNALLGQAEALYGRSLSGIAALPTSCHTGINAARLLYRAIGREITGGIDPVTTRAVTSRQRKLRLLAEAAGTRLADRSTLTATPVAAAAPLIAAVMAAPAPLLPAEALHWWNVRARSERMIELLAGFEARRGRAADAGRA